MKLFRSLEKLEQSNLKVEEFDRSKHMVFAKNIMDMDEELSLSQVHYNPAVFGDEELLGKISYEKYIKLLLDDNWRLFVILLGDQCVGYIHTFPGKYKNSIYIGSFVITKHFAGKGYGKIAMTQFEQLIKNEYSIMILNVAIDNKRAVNLYTHAGFHATHMMMSKKLKH